MLTSSSYEHPGHPLIAPRALGCVPYELLLLYKTSTPLPSIFPAASTLFSRPLSPSSLLLTRASSSWQELQNNPCFHIFRFGRRHLPQISAAMVDLEHDLLRLHYHGEMPFQFPLKSNSFTPRIVTSFSDQSLCLPWPSLILYSSSTAAGPHPPPRQDPVAVFVPEPVRLAFRLDVSTASFPFPPPARLLQVLVDFAHVR